MAFLSYRRVALLTSVCFGLPATALADDIVLDDIVVSAGIFPVEAQAYGRAYTVLTAEDIDRRGVTTVQDALRAAPGVSVVSSGETRTAVRIRGGENNHVLFLIDGVEADESGNGDFNLTGIPLEDVERIEILRGPQSTIYGSNAMSGVISITTKKAEEPGTTYGGGIEIGGQGSRAANAWIRHRSERGGVALSLGMRDTDGEDGSRTGGDTEYNDRKTIALNGQYDLTDTVTAGFTLRKSWQDYGYDDAIGWGTVISDPDDYIVDAPSTGERDRMSAMLWLEAEAMDGRLLHRFTLTGMQEDNAYFFAGAPNGDNRATNRGFRYKGSYALDGTNARDAAQKLNFAVEAERETYRASFAGTGTFKRESQSVALEYQGRFDNGLDVQAGVRHDFNEVFKDATSWNIAAAWNLPGHDIRLRGSVGKAVVNPTMFEQFGWVPGTYAGNANLKPEESLGYELGADFGFAQGRGTFGVTLFANDVKDLITGAGTTSINVAGTSHRKGVELNLGMQATDWLLLNAEYTYTDARDASGNWLTRRPRHELGLQASADFAGGRGQVTAELRHVAGNYDTQFWGSYPVQELPDFTTVNLSARYDLTDRVQLTGRVVNLFDEDYSETWGYYGQSRTAYIGLKAKW